MRLPPRIGVVVLTAHAVACGGQRGGNAGKWVFDDKGDRWDRRSALGPPEGNLRVRLAVAERGVDENRLRAVPPLVGKTGFQYRFEWPARSWRLARKTDTSR